MNNNIGEQKNKYTVEIGKDYLIHISNNKETNCNKKIIGNKEDIILEILFDSNDHSIVTINCILSFLINKYDLKLPKYEDLVKLNTTNFTYDSLNSDSIFRIFYDKNNLNIVLKSINEIKSYYSEGRVDFYFDNNNSLCDIRVKNLTKEEYNVLDDEQYELGYYLENTKKNKNRL